MTQWQRSHILPWVVVVGVGWGAWNICARKKTKKLNKAQRVHLALG